MPVIAVELIDPETGEISPPFIAQSEGEIEENVLWISEPAPMQVIYPLYIKYMEEIEHAER
jgi:hypothetical protein